MSAPTHRLRIADLSVGLTAQHVAVIDAPTVAAYADLVGDHNPVHGDETYARETAFMGPIAHGLLVAGYAQTALTALVAPGGVSVAYSIDLVSPVPVGSRVLARATCTSLAPTRRRAVFDITVSTDPDGVVAVRGEATIAFPREDGS